MHHATAAGRRVAQEVGGILKPESMRAVAGRDAAFSISGFPLSARISR
jgi:hypothetical protein